nr:uncharacterized protein LOC129274797 [Lytechinus pictus]
MTILRDKGPSPYRPMDHIIISPPGVHKILSELDIHKASGPDKILARLLRGLATELTSVFSIFFQASLDQGIIPAEWKMANVSPIFKKGAVKLMLPAHASASNCQWVYAINYGGGIVSGDNIKIQARIKDQCCAMITTQASTKVYHSEDEQVSVQILEGIAESGSTLAVLQDPVTCFAKARYKQKQSFDVSEDSNLILMDWLTAGRIARGECWNFTRYLLLRKIALKTDNESLLLCRRPEGVRKNPGV